MKKISILLFVLIVLSPPLFAQRTAANWGNRILFGTTFVTTDSLKVHAGSRDDTVKAATLYSDVLSIPDWIDGMLAINPVFTNVSGGSDSLRLFMRRVIIIRDNSVSPTSVTVKFGPWKHIGSSLDAGVFYSFSVNQTDSSWWMPCNGRQYRLDDTSVSTDKTLHKVTDFLR